MELGLSGKVALVTGSSKGIGFAIAEALYTEGCKVALNGRDSKNLDSASKDMPGSIGIVGDVTSIEDAKRVVSDTVSHFGKLDILICNVGSGRSVPPGNETPDEWQRVFALNLWSATNSVEASRNALVESSGVIVCVSSICGSEVIPGAPITYSTAKAALHAYVRGIARPLGEQGIRINAVAPGNILFDGSVWSRKLREDTSAVQAMLNKDVSLARLGTPQEIASLVTYLVSTQSQFATGAVWMLDGGQVHS
jgi:3-oxoacyl-[acyl-carrier protein] reductase